MKRLIYLIAIVFVFCSCTENREYTQTAYIEYIDGNTETVKYVAKDFSSCKKKYIGERYYLDDGCLYLCGVGSFCGIKKATCIKSELINKIEDK